MKKGTIIFDLDDTLFDTQSFKRDLFALIRDQGVSEQILQDSYDVCKKEKEVYSFVHHLEVLEKRFNHSLDRKLYEQVTRFDFEKYVPQEIKHLLTALDSEYELWLLSKGNKEFQMVKIQNSGLEDFFPPEKIIITEGNKEDIMFAIPHTEPTYFVNDKITENKKAHERNSAISYITVCATDHHGRETFCEYISSVRELPNILNKK